MGLGTFGCWGEGDERAGTEEALGVQVEEFPTGQGPAGFDELPEGAPKSRFEVAEEEVTGPSPQYSYERRPIVRATAPDGSRYEAYCGYAEDVDIVPLGDAGSSDRRQWYGTHHGATYYPESVFIGKRVGGRIQATLVFTDVGSHTTAPHALSIDSQGRCHLVVADVNIFQDNRLELYWVVGDPETGRWSKAWLLERRGFTSWAHPRSLAWKDSVHLLWDWVDASFAEGRPLSGLFYVRWSPDGFGRKVRVGAGVIESWDAAIAPDSGVVVAVYSTDDGVFGAVRGADGAWTRPAQILPKRTSALSLEAADGRFTLRAGAEATQQWAITLL